MGLAIVPFAWACSSRPVKTIGNLRNAVLYERGAAERCRACAVRAQEEGCFDAARLFAALARSEEIQAEHQLRLLNGYGERMAWEALPERCEICEMPVSVAVEAVIPDRVP